MPLIQVIVPIADIERDESLRRIVRSLEKGKQQRPDLISLANYLRSDLTVDVLSTST
jgi:hypothetical protein